MKFNQPQLALLVTEHGLPIGYEVYPGSTFEGHTLKDAITKIESKYHIKEVIVVTDSAMLSKDNITLLDSLGYVKIKDGEEDYKEIQLNGKERLIVSFSENNAKKDAYDRQKAIDRLLTKIDQKKIEREARWDGLHGVITNNFDMAAKEIINQYHGLWQIEEGFRITKHDLKVRPIFHWTPRRVRAHIAICFMAFTCARHLSYRVKIQKEPMSVEKIRQALTSVQMSILKHIKTGKLYGIPSVIRYEAKEIYHTVGLKLSDVPFLLR